LRARDAGLALELQLLIYPVVDHRPTASSYRDFAERYAGFNGDPDFGDYVCRLTADCWQQYIPDPDARSDPDASPIRAATHADLAPAFVLVAEHDVLRAEAIDYTERLRASGVAVQLASYTGQVHGFYPFVGLLEDARRAVASSADALRRAFATRYA
jgi:acetyl esterase